LAHRGEADVWYRGAMLEDDGVTMNDPKFFAIAGRSSCYPKTSPTCSPPTGG
jgi:hypothetical protein